MMVGAAVRGSESAWSPLPLAAVPSPVSASWPRRGYGNKAFSGREWDPEIGLYYYRARYYDPKIGRFISEDPIGFAGGVNLYSYVDNNPVLAGDPSGLSAYLYCEVIPSARGGGLVGGFVLHMTQARHCYIRVICPGDYDVTST
jgi:RHS repeat-associated protein